MSVAVLRQRVQRRLRIDGAGLAASIERLHIPLFFHP